MMVIFMNWVIPFPYLLSFLFESGTGVWTQAFCAYWAEFYCLNHTSRPFFALVIFQISSHFLLGPDWIALLLFYAAWHSCDDRCSLAYLALSNDIGSCEHFCLASLVPQFFQSVFCIDVNYCAGLAFRIFSGLCYMFWISHWNINSRMHRNV
jgi:hypothetical protein